MGSVYRLPPRRWTRVIDYQPTPGSAGIGGNVVVGAREGYSRAAQDRGAWPLEIIRQRCPAEAADYLAEGE